VTPHGEEKISPLPYGDPISVGGHTSCDQTVWDALKVQEQKM